MPKSPTNIDRLVGARVRMRRMIVGMSQGKLGEAIGVTFQQIQKYEKGTNRISVSRLHQMAEVLGVAVSAFYEGPSGAEAPAKGADDQRSAVESPEHLLGRADALKLLRAFGRIDDAKVRRGVVALVESLAPKRRPR